MKGTFGVSSVLVGDITLGEDSGFRPSLSLEASCSIHGQQIFFSGCFSLLRIVQKELEKSSKNDVCSPVSSTLPLLHQR